MVTRWTFTDTVTSTNVTFEINPDTGGTPDINRSIGTEFTTVPSQKTLLYTNANPPREIDFSGSIITQSAYDTFVIWVNKSNPILLTDDLGRQFTIVITDFTPKRTRNSTTPYYHTYDVKALVVA